MHLVTRTDPLNFPRFSFICSFYVLRTTDDDDSLGIAFTSVPDNFDVEKLILVRHLHLFDRGLDETSFDHTVELFVETLQELNVDPDLIAEAQAVIRPLRTYFEEGAELARQRKQASIRQQRMKQVGLAAVVVATVAILATKTMRRGKK